MFENINIRKPILKRILAILFVAMFLQFFLSLGFNITGYYLDLKNGISFSLNNQMDKLKNNIERILSLGIPLTELPQFNQELEKEIKGEYVKFICIVNTNNTILYHSDPIQCGSKLEIDFSDSESHADVAVKSDNNMYIFSKSISDARGSVVGYIVAGYPKDFLYNKMLMAFLRMVASSFIAGMLGIFLIIFFYRKDIEKPLSKLLATVVKIGDGYWQEIEINTDESETELGSIALAINKMIKELNAIFSEKEELLNQLKIEEERFRKIIDITEMGIVVVKDDKIIFANPGFFKIVNVDYESTLEGTSIFNFFFPLDVPFLSGIFKDVLVRGERQFFDSVRLVDNNKNEIFCSLEVSLLTTSEWGKQLISLTFHNITEKVKFTNELKNKNKELEDLITKYQSSQLALQVANEKLENALIAVEKANEELKKVDQIKDVFFSTITHELKTPISLIQGYIGMLKNDNAVKSSTLASDIMVAIERASKRLVNLTEEIMELLRIKSGKLSLNRNLTYLILIIKPVIAELEPLFNMKNITIETENIDQLPIVNVDSKKMETVIRNILTNSIKFSKEGGKITIKSEVTEESGNKYIHLQLTDEGCGVSANNLDKIFGEFFTIAPPTQASKDIVMKGSGLGLSIAKGIVEAHNGKIWAESPGFDPENFPGMTFHILLPVNID